MTPEFFRDKWLVCAVDKVVNFVDLRNVNSIEICDLNDEFHLEIRSNTGGINAWWGFEHLEDAVSFAKDIINHMEDNLLGGT